CWPPGPLARRERRAIPGAVCEERATKPAGLRAAARRGAAAGGHLLCCRSSAMSDIAFVAAPRICPPGARAKVSILLLHRPLDAAVAPLAFLVLEDGLEKMLAPEIRPICGSDPDFGIGDLPEKKVADAHFPAGADQQIGIRDARGVEKPRNRLFADRSPVPVVVELGMEAVKCVHELRAPAVIEGDVQNHAGVFASLANGVFQLALYRRLELLDPSNG